MEGNTNIDRRNFLHELQNFEKREEFESREFERQKTMRAMKREEKAQRAKKKKIVGIAAIGATAFLSVVGWKSFSNSRRQEQIDHKEPQIEQNYDVRPKREKKAYENLYGKDNSLNYIKNLYIEKYEQITGDTTLTTKDIAMYCASSQNYVYVDDKTGQMITHGSHPEETEMKLLSAGVSWHTVENVDVYRVKKKEGGTIDSIAKKDGKLYSIVEGYQYGKERVSVLDEIGEVIPMGLDYINVLDLGNEDNTEALRKEFVKAAKEYEEKEEQNKNLSAKNEMEEEDIER